MTFRTWLQNLRSALSSGRSQPNLRRRGSLRAAPHRLTVEALEDRLTPSLVWGGTSSSAPAGVEWAPPPPPPLLADFTGDGILDRINGGWVTVEPGLGDGTFADPIEAGAWAHYWAVADFNGDGRLDLATIDSNSAGDNPLGSVLLGRGNGTFYHVEPIDVGLAWPTGMGTGDFNGDGRQDVAIAGEDWDGAETFVVLINDGNWPSSPPLHLLLRSRLAVAQLPRAPAAPPRPRSPSPCRPPAPSRLPSPTRPPTAPQPRAATSKAPAAR